MIVENPAALNYLFDDEVFLLASEKELISAPQAIEPEPAVQTETMTETPVIKEPEIVETPKPFEPAFLGKNAKRYLITTYYAEHDHIHPEHLIALTAVLKRLNFELSDVAIINLSRHADADQEQLLSFFKPEKLLVLGQKAIPAESEITTINQKKLLNGLPVLYTFSFDEMMTDVDKKRQFWEQVKNL